MPIIKSAKKKVRQDKKRRAVNLKVIGKLKKGLNTARKAATEATLKSTMSLIDQAAKKKIIHKNKAARLKSRLAKRLGIKGAEKTENKKVSARKSKSEPQRHPRESGDPANDKSLDSRLNRE